jgi:CheY-like chemotaxis protein
MPKKILAIDDDVHILPVLAEMLGRTGYEVVTAGSGSAGLRALADGGIDLVVLDVKMPGMDGYETYEEIRHNSRTGKIPVLFLTAFKDAFSADKDEAMKAWLEHFGEGTTDVLYKPVSPEDLTVKVEGLIGPAED